MNRCVAVVLLILPGVVLIVLSVAFGWYIFPEVFHNEVVKNIRLVEGSDTWNKWSDPSLPIYLTFYIHHVTNPDEVEHGRKPIFKEKGPYAYRQRRVKVDFKQEDGLNTVKYREVKTYFFDSEMSKGNREDDMVNVVNIPFVAVIAGVYKQLPVEFIAGMVGNVLLQNETLIRRNVRVGELLFQGFDVTKYTNSLLGQRLPQEFAGGRFGLYKGKNGSQSEEWHVYTGYDNPNDFGRVKAWDGRAELNFWRKYSDCDKIHGTDGSIFHPFLTKEFVLVAFSPDICRSISAVYDSDIEHRGIPGYRFKAPKWVFEDPRTREENRCYCLKEKLDECSHSGVLPLNSCMGGAPIWMSSPYFLGADIRYLSASGLPPPTPELHETFIDLEPTSGLVLRAHKRIQINVEVTSHRKVRALQNLATESMLFPLIWADEGAELDEALADDIKSKLFTPVTIVNIAKWALLALGIILFIAGVCVFSVKYVMNTDLSGISNKLKEVRSGSIVSIK